jgi:hypothetical protein
MNYEGNALTRTPRMFPITPVREYRLRKGVTLLEASFRAGISLTRASEIERYPDRARPGEIERLKKAVDGSGASGSAA